MHGRPRMMPTKLHPGVFLDPDLFQMLAHSVRLQLPEQPLQIPTWQQAGCLTFHLQLSHVLRVGHLQPLQPSLPIAGTAANVLGCD